MKTHSYECTICNAKFVDKYRFNRHIKCVHRNDDDECYTCSVCDKRFALKGYLQKHMKIHNKETKDNQCEICGRKFMSEYHLNYHK